MHNLFFDFLGKNQLNISSSLIHALGILHHPPAVFKDAVSLIGWMNGLIVSTAESCTYDGNSSAFVLSCESPTSQFASVPPTLIPLLPSQALIMDMFLTTPPRLPTYYPEQIARYLFRQLVDENDEATGQWRCKVCTRACRQEEGRGYTNLINHIRARHDDYQERIRAAASAETGAIVGWVSQRSQNRFN